MGKNERSYNRIIERRKENQDYIKKRDEKQLQDKDMNNNDIKRALKRGGNEKGNSGRKDKGKE